VAALALVPSDALVVFDEQSREWTTLRRGLVGWPSWSRDGRFLRVFWFEQGLRPTQCEVIRAGDWTTERVVELPELRPSGMFGFWTGTTPDGTVLAIREASAWGIYALDLEAP
jgi:hypothetical protein